MGGEESELAAERTASLTTDTQQCCESRYLLSRAQAGKHGHIQAVTLLISWPSDTVSGGFRAVHACGRRICLQGMFGLGREVLREIWHSGMVLVHAVIVS